MDTAKGTSVEDMTFSLIVCIDVLVVLVNTTSLTLFSKADAINVPNSVGSIKDIYDKDEEEPSFIITGVFISFVPSVFLETV